MIRELKQTVEPVLFAEGFAGQFPHYRRHRNGLMDLLSFQFDKYGGGFCIEIAQCPEDGYRNKSGNFVAGNNIKAWDIEPIERLRIKPGKGPFRGSWFRFDSDTAAHAARTVLPHLSKANDWWFSSKQEQTKVIQASWYKPPWSDFVKAIKNKTK